MKLTAFIPFALALAISLTAHATRQPDHCKPEPKPRDPPAVSKPEPKAPAAAPARSSRDVDGQRDTGTLCSRWPSMVFCEKP